MSDLVGLVGELTIRRSASFLQWLLAYWKEPSLYIGRLPLHFLPLKLRVSAPSFKILTSCRHLPSMLLLSSPYQPALTASFRGTLLQPLCSCCSILTCQALCFLLQPTSCCDLGVLLSGASTPALAASDSASTSALGALLQPSLSLSIHAGDPTLAAPVPALSIAPKSCCSSFSSFPDDLMI